MAINSTRELLRALRKRKIPYTKRRGGHICVEAPKGLVFMARTPSDHRAIKNALSVLRKYGVDLEAPPGSQD
jgi:hypothetical protein